MSKRFLLIVAVLLLALWWWFSPNSSRVSMPSALGEGIICPAYPPVVSSAEGEPLQTDPPPGLEPFIFPHATMIPLAGFSMQAKVLSRANYRLGLMAEVSHVDLLVVWGNLMHSPALNEFEFSQSGRFGYYRITKPTSVPESEIVSHIANVHLIPANRSMARAIARIHKGDEVRIDGWLVEVRHEDGWFSRSSLSRTDTGAGACEVIVVCNVTMKPGNP